MKTMKITLAFVMAILAAVLPANAQTTTTSTTLSSAVGDSTTRTFNIASATGWSSSTSSAQYFYWVDGEQGRVVTVSGTTVTVDRQVNPRRHASGATIYFGQSATLNQSTNAYSNGVFFNGLDPLGPCTGSANSYLPVINTATASVWNCDSVTGRWNMTYSGAVPTSMNQIQVTYAMLANGSLADQAIFLANRAYRIIGIREVHSTAGSDAGTVTIHVEKETGTTAPAGGTTVMSGTFNAKGTANTVQAATLSTTTADTILAAGDRLSVDFTGTLTALAGVVVTVDLIPN